jgi:hypothetical protein
MAPRKKQPQAEEAIGATPLRAGMPVRLTLFDWPFLYSVLSNGDFVINKRLPQPAPPRRSRKHAREDAGDALIAM